MTAALPCRLVGFGAALPRRRETNDDLARTLDTSDEWIRTRTGIGARHVATTESTTHLATTAARRALDDGGVDPSDLGLVVVATSTPDSACPATAARVAHELGSAAVAFDVSSACTGFVHAFTTAVAVLRTTVPPPHTGIDAPRHALVVGADRYRTLTDPADRSTFVLFGDGAGAVVIADDGSARSGAGIVGIDLGTDPDGLAALEVAPGERWLRMDGPEVFRRAVRALVGSGRRALANAGCQGADVSRYVPHQANLRIIEAVATRLGIAESRVEVDVVERANTSAASIPLALHAMVEADRVAPGDLVLLGAVGAGMGYGSLALRWGR